MDYQAKNLPYLDYFRRERYYWDNDKSWHTDFHNFGEKKKQGFNTIGKQKNYTYIFFSKYLI